MSSFASLLQAHGANPEKLYAALDIPMPEDIVDFSTNASVLPWPGFTLDLPDLASHYPDYECLELRRLTARREGCSISNILFTNGSNEALYLLASLLMGGRAAVLQPAYSEYRRALAAYGVETTDIFSLDRAGDFDSLFLSNPCNPTGDYIPWKELLERVRASRTLFVVDEAYVDFLMEDDRGRGQVGDWPPNLLLLRSLTKFYHLSGLRAGYVLGPEEWIGRLKTRQPTWSVNAIAQALALDFMGNGDFEERSREFYRAETPRFIQAIRNSSFPVRSSKVHYFLVGVEDDEGVLKGLLRRGLVVRHTRNFPSLDGRWFRVATRLPGENDRLAAALGQLKKEGVF